MPVNSFDHYPMSWKPDLRGREGPKYLALAALLEADIQSGALKAGTRLPPQRELADFLDVNLSTVSRAFRLCEERGLLSAAVGSGTFVSSGAAAKPILLGGPGDTRIIEMGAIIPDTEANRRVKQYMGQLLKRPDALNLLSYGTPEGSQRCREAGAAWMGRSGFCTDAGRIVPAAGGQNALTASLAALFERGDKVGTDPLTYPGVKIAAKLLGIQLVPIQSQNGEMTGEGIRFAVQHENVKGIYVIPDFHNPTAHIMSVKTREMIAQIARDTGLLVIEDGLNNLLEEQPAPPIASFAPEHIIYLSSLSKTISAGLRTAFIHAPDRYRQALVTALYAMNISIPPLLATVSAGLIEEGIADEIVAQRKQGIARRNRIVNEVLSGYAVAGELTCPLRYLQLPEPLTGEGFERLAEEAGVQVYGAERFVIGSKPAPRAVRLAVTTPPTPEALAEGARRLKRALSQAAKE